RVPRADGATGRVVRGPRAAARGGRAGDGRRSGAPDPGRAREGGGVIFCKSWSEIQTMDRCNRVVLDVLKRLREMVTPGVSTHDLDRKAEEWTRAAGAIPAFKGYRGYPASLCASPNDVIVHGIPNRRPLEEGDILGLDYGVIIDGLYGD